MKPEISEHDEFLLSRLLDGDLPEQQAGELRRRIELEPGLRDTFEQLGRVHTLLARRREDQPTIDWAAFRRQVMSSIEAANTPSHRTIRFPTWLSVGAPLAAAAAIALVLTVHRVPVVPAPGSHSPAGGAMPLTLANANRTSLVVRVQRPASAAHTDPDRLRVTYVRSDVKLAEGYQQSDRQLAEGPSFVAAVPRGPEPREMVVEDTPL